MGTCKAIVSHGLVIGLLYIGLSVICCVPSCAAEAPTPSVGPPQAGIIATVPVGSAPAGLAVNSATNRVYVANFIAGTVSILDGNTNTVIKTIPVGKNPSRIAVNPVTNLIYVTNYEDSDMTVLNGETHDVIAKIPVEAQAHGVAVNPVTNRIYVVNEDEDVNLRIFDGKTNAMLTSNTLGSGPQEVAVNPAMNRVYVAVGNQMSVIDGKTNAVIGTVRLASVPQFIDVSPINNRIYVTITDLLYVIDGATNSVLSTTKLAKGLRGVAVNPMTGQVYIVNSTDQTVSVFDGITNVISSTIPVTTKGIPHMITVNPVTNRVYVSMMDTNAICILDGNTFLTEAGREFAKSHSTTLPAKNAQFEERFSAEKLDPTRWAVTRSEPFPGSMIDITQRNNTDRWLRLRLDTSTSPNQVMKYHGVRTQNAMIEFEHSTEISFSLDWNNPENSDEMSAGIYLCPDAKSMAPGINTSRYIKVMYYGGHGDGPKARIEITIRGEGGEHIIYDEGYNAFVNDETGTLQFEYRNIGIQQIRMVVDKHEIAVWENNKQLCRSSFKSFNGLVAPLTWPDSYLFLQQECAVGYPAREVFFSNIHVHRLQEQPKP